MALSPTTTNGAPTLSRTPVKDGGQFVDDVAKFQAMTKSGIRFAANFAGADIGAKVNAAIAELPRGGDIWLPEGALSFSTPIVIATSRIRLMAPGAYDRHSPVGATTHLTYTGGSGSAITVGNSDGVTRVQGVQMFNFRLDFPEIAGPAIDILDLGSNGRFHDVIIKGTGNGVGTGVRVGNNSTVAWRSTGLYIWGFEYGLNILGSNHWSNYDDCVFNSNDTGVKIGESSPSSTCSVVNFRGCDFEGNIVAIEVDDAQTVNITGGYFESANDTTARMLTVGLGAQRCENINFSGNRDSPTGGAARYAIEIGRVRGMTVEGNQFNDLKTGAGTITSDGTPTVEGVSGTAFLTELTIGGRVRIEGVNYKVASITDNDTFVATGNVPTATAVSYTASGHVIKNNGTSVNQLAIRNNMYGENAVALLIDDTTGVTVIEDRYGHTTYPNVPPMRKTLVFNQTETPVAVTLANSPAIYTLSDLAAGTVEFDLPAAIPGMEYIFHVAVSQQMIIDPNGTDTLALPSTRVQITAGGGGKHITANVKGAWVHLKCETAGQLECMGFAGTWTAEA